MDGFARGSAARRARRADDGSCDADVAPPVKLKKKKKARDTDMVINYADE
jgi:hypothetical protein